jgi:hypothetical protein
MWAAALAVLFSGAPGVAVGGEGTSKALNPLGSFGGYVRARRTDDDVGDGVGRHCVGSSGAVPDRRVCGIVRTLSVQQTASAVGGRAFVDACESLVGTLPGGIPRYAPPSRRTCAALACRWSRTFARSRVGLVNKNARTPTHAHMEGLTPTSKATRAHRHVRAHAFAPCRRSPNERTNVGSCTGAAHAPDTRSYDRPVLRPVQYAQYPRASI